MTRVAGHVCVGGERARHASIAIRVADPDLAARLEAAIADAVGATLSAVAVQQIATVRVTAAGDARQCADAVAVIAVTRANRAELLALAEAAESAGAAGVQLIWDGRPRVCEGAVFRVLEAWRGAARRCPLVLAADLVPAPELLRAIARRKAAAAPGDTR